MKGNFSVSLKIAKDVYGYQSPEEPGSLPKGIIYNNKNYILIPTTHTAVCDSKGCQSQYMKFCKDNPTSKKYTTAPVYSNWGKHEICLVCADIDNLLFFEPTKKETNRMMTILNQGNNPMSDSDSDEGDEGDEGESDEENTNDLTMSSLNISK